MDKATQGLPARWTGPCSGVYLNVLGDEVAAGVRRAYSPAKLARLTAVKDSLDPENVFHLDQNIQPSGGR